jgi:hypothetical protein
MKSPFWKTGVALAVLAGLGAYAYFVESKKPADSETKEKVLSVEKEKVRELTLSQPDAEAIRLARAGDGWRLESPLAVAADAQEVDSLLSSLESLEIEAVVAEGDVDLDEFGLASPELTVELLLAGATEPLKLMLGDKVPAGGGIYARVPSRARVFTLPSHIESSLDKQPFDFRDRDVLHVVRDAVRTLEISGPEGRYALARGENEEWSFTEPWRTRAGRWTVDGLVGSLERLRMEAVAAEAAEDLAPFGLDRPERSVVLGLTDGTRKTLEIGSSPEPGKYHAREAESRLIAVIPSSIVDDLAKGMDEQRAKRLLDVATYQVSGFDVTAGGVKHSYARAAAEDSTEQSWSRTAPDAKALETSVVQDALFKIGGIEAKGFVDAPSGSDSYGLDPPAMRVDVRFEDGKPDQWFEIGRQGPDYFARRIDDAALLRLDAEKAEELIKAFEEL